MQRLIISSVFIALMIGCSSARTELNNALTEHKADHLNLLQLEIHQVDDSEATVSCRLTKFTFLLNSKTFFRLQYHCRIKHSR